MDQPNLTMNGVIMKKLRTSGLFYVAIRAAPAPASGSCAMDLDRSGTTMSCIKSAVSPYAAGANSY